MGRYSNPPLSADEKAARALSRNASLAKWSASLLASSLLLVFLLLFLALTAASIPVEVRDHPVAAVAVLLVLASYTVSFVCLSRIRRSDLRRSLPLWLWSLMAIAVPLLILLVSSEWEPAALVLCAPEVIAVVLHLVAIRNALPSRGSVPAA